MNGNKDDLNRLEADIAIIKDAIRANNGFLRDILTAPAFGRFMTGFGIGCIGLCLSWHYALSQSGSLSGMEPGTLWALLALSMAAVAALGIWKVAACTAAGRRIDRRYSLTMMVREFAEHPVFFFQFLVLALTVFAAATGLWWGIPHAAVAAVSAGLGTVFMLYATAFLLAEYLPLTVWLYILAAGAILLPDVAPLILAGVGFGGGFVPFGLYCIVRKAADSRQTDLPGDEGRP